MGINFPWGQTGRRRRRAPVSHGGGGGAHIVSIYHSHVTKFSPHRETLLTSTEHVALPILYIIAAAFQAQHFKLTSFCGYIRLLIKIITLILKISF